MAFDLTAQLNLTLNKASLSEISKQISKQLNSTDVNVKSNAKDVAKMSSEIRRADDDIRAFGAQAGLAAKRFAAFTLSAGVMIQVASAIRSAVDESMNFNAEMIRLTQITDGNKGAVKDIIEEVTKLSISLGVSSTELMKQATTLKQASLSARETKIALEALAKASLAPSFDNMAKTTEAAIAAMKQFNIPAEELKNTLGSINAVAAAFAVEAGDLGQAITRAGGAFKAAGGDLHELNAMMTAIRQTTRESAESIATGLRTIFTRLQRTSTVDALRSIGVNLRYTADEAKALGNVNLTGQFIGVYQAVLKVSEALSNMPTTDARFSKIVEELGGYRQISKVIPLIQQQTLMQNALNVSRAGGASLDANAIQAQEGYIVRLTKIKEKFLEFMRSVTESTTFKVLFSAFEIAANGATALLSALKPLLPMLTALATMKMVQGAGGLLGGFFGSLSKSPPVTNIKGRHLGGAIRMQKGGVVPGHGSGDIVPAMLEPGEVVIPKRFAEGGGNIFETAEASKKSSLKTLYDVGLKEQKNARDNYTEIKINKTFGKNAIEAHLRDRETIRGEAKTVWKDNKIEIDTKTLEKLKNRKNKNNTWNSIIQQSEHQVALTNIKKFDQEEIKVLAKIKQKNIAMKKKNSFMQFLGLTELNSGTRTDVGGKKVFKENEDENRLNKISGAIGEKEVFKKNKHLYIKLKDAHGADFYDPTAGKEKFIEVKTNWTPANDDELRAKALIGYSEIRGNPFQNTQPELIPTIVIDYQQAAKTPIKKASGGFIVPGVGNTDSVPMDLASGSYVIRKSSTKKLGFAKGGMVPALLTPGELVIGPDSAKSIGSAKLERMNRQGKFALGGRVGMAEGGDPNFDSDTVSKFMKNFATEAYNIQNKSNRTYTEISGQSKSKSGETFKLLDPKEIMELRRAIVEAFSTGSETVKAKIGGKLFESNTYVDEKRENFVPKTDTKQSGFISNSMFKMFEGAKWLGQGISSGAKKVGPAISEGAKKVGPAISEGAQKVGPAISEGAKSAWGSLKGAFTQKLTSLTEYQIGIIRGENDVLKENADLNVRNLLASKELEILSKEKLRLEEEEAKLDKERVKIISESNQNRIDYDKNVEKINDSGKDKVADISQNMKKRIKKIDDREDTKILALEPERQSIKKLDQQKLDISTNDTQADIRIQAASQKRAVLEQERDKVKATRAPSGGAAAKKADLARLAALISAEEEIEFKAVQEKAGNAVLSAAISKKSVEETDAYNVKVKKIQDDTLKSYAEEVDATAAKLDKVKVDADNKKQVALKQKKEKDASLGKQSDKNIIASRSVKEEAGIINKYIKDREELTRQPPTEVFTGNKLAAQRAEVEIAKRKTGNAVIDDAMAITVGDQEKTKVTQELIETIKLQIKSLNPLIDEQELLTVSTALAEKHMNEMAVMPLPSAGGPTKATSSGIALTLQEQGKDIGGKKTWKTQAKEGIGHMLSGIGMDDAMGMYEQGKAGKGGRIGGMVNVMKGGGKLLKGMAGNSQGQMLLGGAAALAANTLASNIGSQDADTAVEKGDTGTYRTTQAVGGAVSGAAAGAAFGAMAGPVGIATGAIVGGLYGLTSSLIASGKEIREARIGAALQTMSKTIENVEKGVTSPEDALDSFKASVAVVAGQIKKESWFFETKGIDLQNRLKKEMAPQIGAMSKVTSMTLASESSALIKKGASGKESIDSVMQSKSSQEKIDQITYLTKGNRTEVEKQFKTQLTLDTKAAAEKEAVNSARQLSNSMDQLASFVSKATDVISSMEIEFSNLGTIFSQGVNATKLQNENRILGNAQGYETSEVQNSIGRTFGVLGDTGKEVKEKYGTMGAIRNALTTSLASGVGSGHSSDNFAPMISSDIRQRVGNAPGAEAIIKQVENQIIGLDFQKLIEESGGDVSAAVDKIMGQSEKVLLEAVKRIADMQEEAASKIMNGFVTLANQQVKINGDTNKLKMMEIDLGVSRAELQKMSNGQFVTNQLDTAKQNIATTQEKSAATQAATFGGTSYEGQGPFDVHQLYNILKESQSRIQSSAIKMNEVGNAALTTTPQGTELIKSNIQAKSDFEAAHTALRNMVDAGQQLSEMYKAQAEALKQSRASILGYAEALENADPKERRRLKSGEAIANKVATGVNFNDLTKREKEDYKKFSSAAGKDYQLESGKSVAQVEDMKGVALAQRYGLGGKLAATESGIRDATGKSIDAQALTKDAQKAIVDFQVEQQKQQFDLLMKTNIEVGLSIQQAIFRERESAATNLATKEIGGLKAEQKKKEDLVQEVGVERSNFSINNKSLVEKAFARISEGGNFAQAKNDIDNMANSLSPEDKKQFFKMVNGVMSENKGDTEGNMHKVRDVMRMAGTRTGNIKDVLSEDAAPIPIAEERHANIKKELALEKDKLTQQQAKIAQQKLEIARAAEVSGGQSRANLAASGVRVPEGVPLPPIAPVAPAGAPNPNLGVQNGGVANAALAAAGGAGGVANAPNPNLGVPVPPVGNNQAQTNAMLEYLSANQQQNDADFAAGISAIEAQYSVGGGATQPTGGNVGGARNKPFPELDEAINQFFLSTTPPNIPGNIAAANAKMDFGLGGAPTVTTSSQSTISAKKEGGAEISEMDKLASALQPFSDNFSMSIGRFETSVYSFGESVTHFDEAVSKIPQTLELSTSNDVTVKLQDSQEIISALTDSIVSTVISKIREELDNSQSISQKSL